MKKLFYLLILLIGFNMSAQVIVHNQPVKLKELVLGTVADSIIVVDSDGLTKYLPVTSLPSGGGVPSLVAFTDTQNATDNLITMNGNGFLHNYGNTSSTWEKNLFLGENAGNFTMTGIANGFFGNDAGSSITTGIENYGFGNETLALVTTGTMNTAFGSASGYSMVGGSRNSFFGRQSGVWVASGSNNTFFGSTSGFTQVGGGNLTSIDQATLIGSYSNGTQGSTNETVIGYQADGSGSNTVTLGNSSITAIKAGVDYTAVDDRDLVTKGFADANYSGGGGGTIGGTIADGQVAHGNGTDVIQGSSDFTYDGTTLKAPVIEVNPPGTNDYFRFRTNNSNSNGRAIFEIAQISTSDAALWVMPDTPASAQSSSSIEAFTSRDNADITTKRMAITSEEARGRIWSSAAGGNDAGEKIEFTTLGRSGASQMTINTTGRVEIFADPNTGDGVGNRDYNDLRYQSGTRIDWFDTESDGKYSFTMDGNPFIHNYTGNTTSAANPWYQNTFIGEDSGNYSVGDGSSSLGVGMINTGIGAWTLNALTTGQQNVMIGNESGALMQASSYNVGVGDGVMYYAVTNAVNNNMGIGKNVLQNITDAEYNVAMGRNSGFGVASGGNFTNGDHHTLLGQDTEPSANGTTNEIVIGSSARGKGSNTAVVGNSSLTDVYLNGNTRLTGDDFYFDAIDLAAEGINIGSMYWRDFADLEVARIFVRDVEMVFSHSAQIDIEVGTGLGIKTVNFNSNNVTFDGLPVGGTGLVNSNVNFTSVIAESKAGTVVFLTDDDDGTYTIPDTWTQLSGAQITFVNIGGGTATIDVSGTATLNDKTTNTVVLGPADDTGNESVMLIQQVSNSDDWWTIGKY